MDSNTGPSLKKKSKARTAGIPTAEVFDDAMPSTENFAALLKCGDYTKWRELAKCLELPELSINTISDSVLDIKLRDQKAFLQVLARWRERAPTTKEDRKANWRNLRKALDLSLDEFSDLKQVIDELEQRWSVGDDTLNLCKCGKPKALRIKDDNKKLFLICPKPRTKQCKGTFEYAERLLKPRAPRTVTQPVEELHRVLLLEKNCELVNFEALSPHLLELGILSSHEYSDITGRPGVSPVKCFEVFILECLLKPDKGNVVKQFIKALENETSHAGHKEVLSVLEKNKIIKEAKDKDDVSHKRKRKGGVTKTDSQAEKKRRVI